MDQVLATQTQAVDTNASPIVTIVVRTLHGESKLDTLAWEYVALLADKLLAHVVPVRFALFGLIGLIGVAVHMLVLWSGLTFLLWGFWRRSIDGDVRRHDVELLPQQHPGVCRKAMQVCKGAAVPAAWARRDK